MAIRKSKYAGTKKVKVKVKSADTIISRSGRRGFSSALRPTRVKLYCLNSVPDFFFLNTFNLFWTFWTFGRFFFCCCCSYVLEKKPGFRILALTRTSNLQRCVDIHVGSRFFSPLSPKCLLMVQWSL